MKKGYLLLFKILLICLIVLQACDASKNENKQDHISYFGDTPPNPLGTNKIENYTSDIEKEFDLKLTGNWKLSSSEPQLSSDFDNLGYHFLTGKQFYRSLGFFNTPVINWYLGDDSVIIGGNEPLQIKALRILEIDSNHFTAILIHDSVTATFSRVKEK